MPRQTKRGTYLIEFKNGEQVVLGNNYKPWWQHAVEFIYRNFGDSERGWRYPDVANVVKAVKYSNQQFYDDGGLKWCDFGGYQAVIDNVVKGDHLAPVNVADLVFADSPADQKVLTKQLKKY